MTLSVVYIASWEPGGFFWWFCNHPTTTLQLGQLKNQKVEGPLPEFQGGRLVYSRKLVRLSVLMTFRVENILSTRPLEKGRLNKS